MVIIESKLSISEYSHAYLIRDRLFTYLENNLDRSLICLTSDGGYGKTTLVSSFIKEKNHDYIWYALDQLDRNPNTFLSYFLTALYRKKTGDKRQIYEVNSDQLQTEFEHLLSILSTWPTKLIIVLDNYHVIGPNKELETMISQMINFSSDNITFIITSRIRPNLQLPLLKLRNKLAELKKCDLVFSREEVKQFFESVHQIKLQPYEIDLIYSKTEGWAASLQLLVEIIKTMDNPRRSQFWAKFSGIPDIPDVYDYLGNEILSTESDEIRDFLYKTSLLTDLQPDIINGYLDINNATRLIDYLLNHHLFIYQTPQGTIRYHQLFRSYLYKQLANQYQKSEIHSFYIKLADIYERQHNFFNAFTHSVAGGDYVKAARIMKRMSERYHASHFLTLLDIMLENNVPELSQASISLFVFRCIPLHTLNQIIEPLKRKIEQCRDLNDPISLSQLFHQLSAVCFYTGQLAQAEQHCIQSLHLAKQIQDSDIISINLALKSMICWYSKRYSEAKQLAQDALSYPDLNDNFHPHHLALWNLAEVYLAQDNLPKAELLIMETLQMSTQRNDCSAIYPYCSMAKYYRLLGNLDEAINWIKKAETMATQFHLNYDLCWIYIELALTYLTAKNPEKSLACLEHIEDHLPYSVYLQCQANKIKIEALEQLGDHVSAAHTRHVWEQTCLSNQFNWMIEPVKQRNLTLIETEPKLYLYTLGKFNIVCNGKPVSLKRKASILLFQYLITHRQSNIVKEKILEEIFQEGSLTAVNNRFYVALSHLRKSLEPYLTSGRNSSFIKQHGEYFTLSLDQVYLDVDHFQKLANRKAKSPGERIKFLHKAEQLYQDDYFYEYPYVHFLEFEREYNKKIYINILKELANHYWNQGQYEESMNYFDKIIEKDPYQEEVYEIYIQKLLDTNFVLRAKKVADLYCRYIEKELGVPVKEKIIKWFAL